MAADFNDRRSDDSCDVNLYKFYQIWGLGFVNCEWPVASGHEWVTDDWLSANIFSPYSPGFPRSPPIEYGFHELALSIVEC